MVPWPIRAEPRSGSSGSNDRGGSGHGKCGVERSARRDVTRA